MPRFGGPEVLELDRSHPDPVPGPDQVVVRVHAASLNHLDLAVRDGIPTLKLTLPHILGCDAAGDIAEVGSDVTDVEVGDRVVVNPGISCGRCEYCLRGEDSECADYKILGEHLPGTYAEKVAVPAKNVSAAQRATADALLRATGSVEWVEDEKLMDAVTAVSGSGPAYVFLLAEELARAGVEAGLPAELATRLARETVAGSGELLHQSDLPSATLRQNVTSPGGTTAAALEVLMGADGMQSLLTRAVAAATRRSRELAK